MRFAFALGLATLAAIAVAGGGAGSTILKWRSDTASAEQARAAPELVFAPALVGMRCWRHGRPRRSGRVRPG